MNKLLEQIIEKQGNMSNQEFADYISEKSGVLVSRPHWQMMKSGKRNVGIHLLKAIVRAYPDMIFSVILYLLDSLMTYAASPEVYDPVLIVGEIVRLSLQADIDKVAESPLYKTLKDIAHTLDLIESHIRRF